jgi:hypothetical protein
MRVTTVWRGNKTPLQLLLEVVLPYLHHRHLDLLGPISRIWLLAAYHLEGMGGMVVVMRDMV